MFIKVILTILILSLITFTASASTTVTININRIQLTDEIEGFGEDQADWYYYIGLSNENVNIEWKSSPSYQNNDDMQLSDSYTFTTTSIQPYILIMLCEADTISGDDIADISSQTSGSENEFNNFAESISPSANERYVGTFKSQYSLQNNEFISGDQTVKDGSYHKVSGDFDNNLGDENDANLWFSISDNYKLPSVDAGNDIYSRVGDLVNFNMMTSVSVSFGSSIVRYQWDFNGDGVYDAEGQTTSYTYSKAGTYTAKFKITDSYGEIATDTVQVTISTVPPIAGFTFSPTSPYTSDTITFTDTSTDQDGTIASWQWDFGDGKTTVTKSPTHRFSDNGKYNVKLTVTDNDGASSEKQTELTVKNIVPSAFFSFSPSKLYTDTEAKFTDTSTDQDGTIASWEWDFGDGYTSTNQNPAHKFGSNNEYAVKLTVTDNDGDSNGFTRSINVYKPTPIPTPIPILTPKATPTRTKSTTVDETPNDGSSNSTPGFGVIFGILNVFLVILTIKKSKL